MFRRSTLFALAVMTCLSVSCGVSTNLSTPTVDATELASIVYSTQTALAVANAITPVVVQPTETVQGEIAVTQSVTQESTSLPTATLTPMPTVTTTQAPTALPVTDNCINKAEFVEETVPDGSNFTAKQSFVKTWTLRNTGTCAWTTDYALYFVDGTQMGAPSSVPLTRTINVDDTVALSINLVAPETVGEYRGEWKLLAPGDQLFGIGKEADKNFWVEIQVVESVTDLGLGAPASVERFDAESYAWPFGEDDNLRYEIKDGNLVMTARNPVGDLWRVNALVDITDLYVQANFKTGESCSGKNSYGLIVRTYAKEDSNVYNNGYIFTFSCDGMYRLYRLDTGNYVSLIGWTSSTELHSGPNQTNQMGVWAKGDQIRLYVNGKKVAELTDGVHSNGQYGLTVRAEGEDDFQVTVEEISYWELE